MARGRMARGRLFLSVLVVSTLALGMDTGKQSSRQTEDGKTPEKRPVAAATGRGAGTWEVVSLSGDVLVPGSSSPLHGSGRMLVYLPPAYGTAGPMRMMVALHGWDHAPELWRDKSVLGALADRFGVVVACPDMGRTVYETRFFPETTRRWSTVPGTPWLLQVVIPYVREHYDVRTELKESAILGYSTGGRGAVVALGNGADFGFCGSISGTYDLMTLPPGTGEYRIHAQVFGERSRFRERWRAEGSVDPEATKRFLFTEVYLAHGAKDAVVHVSQAETMAAYLKKGCLAYSAEIVPEAGHDWTLWNSRLPVAFEWFERRRTTKACEGCHLRAGAEQ